MLSFRRLRLYAQYDWLTNSRSLAVILGSFTVLLTVAQLLFFRDYINGPSKWEIEQPEAFAPSLQPYGIFLLVVFLLYLSYNLVRIQKGALKKQERLQMLVLPVSMTEKFIVRLAHATLYFTIGAFLSLWVADLLRMLFEPFLGDYRVGFTVPYVLQKIWWLLTDFSGTWLFVAMLLPQLAFCLFGGSLFRRHPLLFTFLLSQAIFTVTIIFVLVMNGILPEGFFDRYGLDITFTPLTARLLYYGLHLAWTALYVFLAYRLFSRQQLLGRSLIVV